MKSIIAALALLFGVALGQPASAQSVDPCKRPGVSCWHNFGADPAYHSRAAAIADAPRVFRQAGYSEKVINAFKAAMAKPGRRVRLVNGDILAFMRTGPSGIMRNVLVAFRQPVVNMEFAAPAEEWTVVVDGETLTSGIPDICDNLYMRVRIVDGCVELTFNAKVHGKVRWGIGSTNGPMPPDVCNAQHQGSDAWSAWYGECDVCIPAYGYIRRVMGENATVPHRYMYDVTQTRQTIRFSRAVWAKLAYICLEDENGVGTCGVYVPPNGVASGWNNRHHVDIVDSFWHWGEDCPE